MIEEKIKTKNTADKIVIETKISSVPKNKIGSEVKTSERRGTSSETFVSESTVENSKIVKTKKSESQASKGLIAVVRIDGEVKVKPEIVNTLYRLRLRKKYSCILINSENKGLMGMLWKTRHAVAYGPIENETLVKLLNARGQRIKSSAQAENSKIAEKFKNEENKNSKIVKLDSEIAAKGLIEGKDLESFGLKPFFRLHPPRKGIKSKLQYPKGVLGNNKKDINKLIERML